MSQKFKYVSIFRNYHKFDEGLVMVSDEDLWIISDDFVDQGRGGDVFYLRLIHEEK